ncbi:MAG: aspartyl protease family protein, partial [Caldimonas sp.]
MKHLAGALVLLIATAVNPLAVAAAAPSVAATELATSTLAAVRRAGGGAAWQRFAMLAAQGRIVTSGLPGRWRRVDDLRGGRYSTATDVSAFRVAEGNDGSKHWRQDPSGAVHSLNAPFALAATATDAWLAERGWLRKDSASAAIGQAETRSEEGHRYDVVTMTPRAGQPIELWFDSSSHQLARTVRQMPISVQTVRYGDYRKVAGLPLPFRIETRDSASSDVETITVESWRPARFATSRTFTAPAPPDDTELVGDTRVELDVDGFVTLPARLNGKLFEFILDTGGHDIITPAVAAKLGLQPLGHGASGGAGAGQLVEQHVRVETLQIGAATLRHQHFYVLPLQYSTVERGARPELGGLLGLELFERLRGRIDYAGRALTLSRFGSASLAPPAHEVPIVFDDDIPLLVGRIGADPGLFAIDTGNSGSTVVQARWARRNGLAEAMKRGIETVSYGAGGASRNWVSRVAMLEIGDARIAHLIGRYAEDEAGAFSSRTEAGNIGTDVLSGFVVDIDYGRGVIGFEARPGYVAPPFSRTGFRAIKEDAA